jgi:nicotinamidase-related amidase
MKAQDANRTAVLVIDMQQGLCVGPDAAHDCAGTIARINAVTRQARDAREPVIFVQHEDEHALVHESAAWQLAAGLEAASFDFRLRKQTPDAFLRTGLERLLKSKGVTQLVVCGMHTEFCIDTTCRRALALDYAVTLVGDAHTSAGNAVLRPEQVIAHHNLTLSNIKSFGPRVTVVNAADVRWSAGI